MLGATIAGLTLVLLAPLGAGAAEGYFYYTSNGVLKFIKDPHDDECLKREGNGHASNETNKTVFLYDNAQCLGTPIDSMRPGDGESISFAGLKFLR